MTAITPTAMTPANAKHALTINLNIQKFTLPLSSIDGGVCYHRTDLLPDFEDFAMDIQRNIEAASGSSSAR